jgi:hypothetical protein
MKKKDLVKEVVKEEVVNKDVVKEEVVKTEVTLGNDGSWHKDGKNFYWYKSKMIEFTSIIELTDGNGQLRTISPSFPNGESPDAVKQVEYNGYILVEEKYGKKSVCYLHQNNKAILRYVSKQVVITFLNLTLKISWNRVDQQLKGLLGLKTNGTTSRSLKKEKMNFEDL